MEKCVICGAEIEKRQSCNPAPLREGRCCLFCDNAIITPYRMAMAGFGKNSKALRLAYQLKEDPTAMLKVEIVKKE